MKNKPCFKMSIFKRKLSPELPQIIGDSQQLNHVFMNIIINAAQAMGGKGTIIIFTVVAPTKDRIIDHD